MKKGLFGLFAIGFLLFAGVSIAGPVGVSGGLNITGVSGTDGVTFPDGTKQTSAVNGSQYQKRVTGSCSSGYAISSIDSTGAVVGCQPMGSGTVTSVDTGTGLTGGPITGSGSISLTNTTVTPGSYTSANITVDSQGRVTSASNGISNFVDLSSAQTIGGAKTFSNDVTMSGNLILPSYGRIYFGTSQVLAYPGANNFFVGIGAGNLSTTGDGNTALGTISLQSNTTGDNNTALGFGALNANLTGSDNTATGRNALMSNTSGYNNTATGSAALIYNTEGYDNTASGNTALLSNTTGFENTAVGSSALSANTTGSENTAMGAGALGSNTVGKDNAAYGDGALVNNTASGRNTAIGRSALHEQSYNNSGTGYYSYNTAVGYNAMYYNQPTASGNAVENTAIGAQALYNNTVGFDNLAAGFYSLTSNNTGYSNTGIGAYSLLANSSGYSNTAIGYYAGASQTTGSNNIYIGYNVTGVAGESNKTYIGNDQTADAYIKGVLHGDGSGLTNVSASTVANGVYTTATYSDPTWLTSVSGGKVSGDISGNAASITGSISESHVTNLSTDLGSKVNKAGDAMTGALSLPSNGFAVGTNQLVVTGGNVGIGTASPGQKLTVAGTIQSTSGGVKFPDGTVQNSAVTGGGGGVPTGYMILGNTQTAPTGYTFVGASIAASGWAAKASMPTARNHLAATALNGKIYAIGGYNGSFLGTNEMYDPATDSWTTKASMPTPRRGLGLATTDEGAIYAIGGENGSYLGTNEMYDPATDSWTTKPSMPTPRSGLGVAFYTPNFFVPGYIYAVGGFNGSYLGTNEVYVPTVESWTAVPSMPTARAGLAVASTCTPGFAFLAVCRLYAIGGENGSVLGTNEGYDGSWTTKASMPTARSELAAVVTDNIYAIGGYNGSTLGTNEMYDPATDSWTTKASMPTARSGLAATATDNIYTIGGHTNSGYKATNEMWFSVLYVHVKN